MVKLKFDYMNISQEKICKENEYVRDILDDYAKQIKKDKLYFMYNGKVLDLKKLNEKKVKDIFKSQKIIYVFDFNIKKQNNNWKLNNIVCPECKNLSIIKYNDDNISLDCFNKHSFEYLTVSDFIEVQKYCKFLKCDLCKNIKNIYKDNFYICSCRKQLCSLCILNHDKTHNIKEYEKKFNCCCEHEQIYISYCYTCNLNLCSICENKHTNHKRKYLKQIKNNNKINDIRENGEELNKVIKIYKKELKVIKDIFNKMSNNLIINMENLLILNDYLINSINNLDNNETIEIINKFNCKKLIKDFNSFLSLNIKEKFLNLIDKLFNKNISFNQIELLYYQKPGKEIKIFSKEFVENNKNNCYLIVKDEIEDISEYYKCKKKFMSEPIKINLISLNPLTDMKNMFCECDSLKFFKSYNFDTSEVTNMNNMFNGCVYLSSIKGILNTKKVEKMNNMFKNCSSLTNIENISNWNLLNAIDISYLFYKCSKINKLSKTLLWNTSNIKNMNYLFCGCYSLEEIPDISFWNTKNVIDMSHIFEGCSKIKSLPDISNWNLCNATDISYMFEGCVNLISLPDISNWNTINIKYMNNLLSNCESLEKLPDISRWNTINVIKMNNMFYYCRSLLYFPNISKWNTSNCKDISQMFFKCESLKNLPDINKWDYKNIKRKKDITFGCNSLLKNSKSYNTSSKSKLSETEIIKIISNEQNDF